MYQVHEASKILKYRAWTHGLLALQGAAPEIELR